MRLRLLTSLTLAGLIGLSAAPSSFAATPATVAPHIATAPHSMATPVWYRYHGARYHWRSHGMYFNHRYYRRHRWHYY